MTIAALATLAFMPPAEGGQGGLESMLPTVITFGAVIFIFYFLILRPQKKRQQEQQAMLDSMHKGDRVILAAGIHGTVSDQDGTVITVQIADNVKVKVEKSSISSVEKK